MLNINNSVKNINFNTFFNVKTPSFRSSVQDVFVRSEDTKIGTANEGNMTEDKFSSKKEDYKEDISSKKGNNDLKGRIDKNKDQISLIKRKIADMDSEKYNQSDKNINVEEMSDSLKKRIIAFPFVVKGIMALIPTYLEQKIDADTFSQVYLERTPHLFARLQFGTDKEEFAKDFAPEVTMAKNINVSCSDYLNGKTQKEQLDNSIRENLDTYLKTPENKNVFYLE